MMGFGNFDQTGNLAKLMTFVQAMAKTVGNESVPLAVDIFLVIVAADDDAAGCLCILISLSA